MEAGGVEAKKEELSIGVNMTKLGDRTLFPFGRRTRIEPPQSVTQSQEAHEREETHDQLDERGASTVGDATQQEWDAIVDAFLEVLKRSVSKRLSNLPPGRAYAGAPS
jgi:hypothetical protein